MSAKEQASRIEQRTLVLSIGGVLVVAVGSIAYGSGSGGPSTCRLTKPGCPSA